MVAGCYFNATLNRQEASSSPPETRHGERPACRWPVRFPLLPSQLNSLRYHGGMSLSLALKETARQIGFDLVGVAPLAAWKDLNFSRQWVEKGYGGEMRYLKNPKRDDPRKVLPSVKSVVCVGVIYNTPLPYSTEAARGRPPDATDAANEWQDEGGARGWISRYAWGEDYHDVMRGKLEQLRGAIKTLAPGAETRVYVDTGPIIERAFSRFSGIGWMGKNTCLINQAKGSWFFLGVLLTSLELDPDLPAPDRCGSCTRCLEACPTGALVEPYVMDASRCIAYFTIELKGSIPAEFRPALGANVFGCDICQDVCPWNSPQRVGVTEAPEFKPMQVEPAGAGGSGQQGSPTGEEVTPGHFETRNPKLEIRPSRSSSEFPVSSLDFHVSGPAPSKTFSLYNPPLEALASLSEQDFRRAFSSSPLKRAKYRGWLRNLCVAMGNSGDPRFVPWLEQACQHPYPVIREHAEWALARLQGAGRRVMPSAATTGHSP